MRDLSDRVLPEDLSALTFAGAILAGSFVRFVREFRRERFCCLSNQRRDHGYLLSCSERCCVWACSTTSGAAPAVSQAAAEVEQGIAPIIGRAARLSCF